ncbi:hypothetical protein AB0K10_30300, partial [Micromonospora sp. NPDC049274]
MAIEVSDDVASFFLFLTGEQFPGLSEDALRLLAARLAEVGASLGDVSPQLATVLAGIAGGVQGNTQRAFVDHARRYVEDPGYLPLASKYVHRVSQGFDDAALQVEYTKLIIVATIVELMIELATALAIAWFFPEVLSEMLVRLLTGKLTIAKWLAELVVAVATMQAVGVGMQVLMDLFVQAVQVADGDRRGLNGKSLATSAWIGSLGGVVGLGVHSAGSAVAKRFAHTQLKTVGEAFTHSVGEKNARTLGEMQVEAFTEVLTEGAANGIQGQGFSVQSPLMTGASGALSGLAGSSGTRAGEWLRAHHPPSWAGRAAIPPSDIDTSVVPTTPPPTPPETDDDASIRDDAGAPPAYSPPDYSPVREDAANPGHAYGAGYSPYPESAANPEHANGPQHAANPGYATGTRAGVDPTTADPSGVGLSGADPSGVGDAAGRAALVAAGGQSPPTVGSWAVGSPSPSAAPGQWATPVVGNAQTAGAGAGLGGGGWVVGASVSTPGAVPQVVHLVPADTGAWSQDTVAQVQQWVTHATGNGWHVQVWIDTTSPTIPQDLAAQVPGASVTNWRTLIPQQPPTLDGPVPVDAVRAAVVAHHGGLSVPLDIPPAAIRLPSAHTSLPAGHELSAFTHPHTSTTPSLDQTNPTRAVILGPAPAVPTPLTPAPVSPPPAPDPVPAPPASAPVPASGAPPVSGPASVEGSAVAVGPSDSVGVSPESAQATDVGPQRAGRGQVDVEGSGALDGGAAPRSSLSGVRGSGGDLNPTPTRVDSRALTGTEQAILDTTPQLGPRPSAPPLSGPAANQPGPAGRPVELASMTDGERPATDNLFVAPEPIPDSVDVSEPPGQLSVAVDQAVKKSNGEEARLSPDPKLIAALVGLPAWDGRTPDCVSRVRKVMRALSIPVGVRDDGSGVTDADAVARSFGGSFAAQSITSLAELRRGAYTAVLSRKPGIPTHIVLVHRLDTGGLVLVETQVAEGEGAAQKQGAARHLTLFSLPKRGTWEALPLALQGPLSMPVTAQGVLAQHGGDPTVDGREQPGSIEGARNSDALVDSPTRMMPGARVLRGDNPSPDSETEDTSSSEETTQSEFDADSPRDHENMPDGSSEQSTDSASDAEASFTQNLEAISETLNKATAEVVTSAVMESAIHRLRDVFLVINPSLGGAGLLLDEAGGPGGLPAVAAGLIQTYQWLTRRHAETLEGADPESFRQDFVERLRRAIDVLQENEKDLLSTRSRRRTEPYLEHSNFFYEDSVLFPYRRRVSPNWPRAPFAAAVPGVKVSETDLLRLQRSEHSDGRDVLIWRVDDEPLYRVDTRHWSEIVRSGFAPRDPTLPSDLHAYQEFFQGAQGFVSTSRVKPSTDSSVVAFQKGYLYEVRPPGGVDIPATMRRSHFPMQAEVVFPGGIRIEHVVRAWRRAGKEWVPEWRNPLFQKPDRVSARPVMSRQGGGRPSSAEVVLSGSLIDGVGYPVSTRPGYTGPWDGAASLSGVVARAPFEVERRGGRQFVRVYVVASQRQDLSGGRDAEVAVADAADVQQEPGPGGRVVLALPVDGALTLIGGRPLAALKIAASMVRFRAELNLPQGHHATPLVRSFLMAVPDYVEVSRTASALVDPALAGQRVFGIRGELEPNVFSVPADVVRNMVAPSVLRGSLVTFTDHPETLPVRGPMADWAGEVRGLDELRSRLYVPVERLRPDFDPWPSIHELQEGSIDESSLARKGALLRNMVVTWWQAREPYVERRAYPLAPEDELLPFAARREMWEEFLAAHGVEPADVAATDTFMERVVVPWADQAAIALALAENHRQLSVDLSVTDKHQAQNFVELRATAAQRAQELATLRTRLVELWAGDDPRAVVQMVDLLRQEVPELDRRFDEIAALDEDYTYDAHVQMVLGQYRRLTYADRGSGETAVVALGILFHDMDKVNSRRQYGEDQHTHDAVPEHRLAVQLIRRYRDLLVRGSGHRDEQRQLRFVLGLVDSDPFGFYLTGKHGADEAFSFVVRLALGDTTAPGPLRDADVFAVRQTYYRVHQYFQADFSSYTRHGRYEPYPRDGEIRTGEVTFDEHFATDAAGDLIERDGLFVYRGTYADKIAELDTMFTEPATLRYHYERVAGRQRLEQQLIDTWSRLRLNDKLPKLGRSRDLTGALRFGDVAESAGYFVDSKGRDWYVEAVASPLQAQNAVVVARFYQLAKVNVPLVRMAINAPELPAGPLQATGLVPSAKRDLEDRLGDAGYLAVLGDGIAVDAWLGNDDVVGSGYDRVVTAKGVPWRTGFAAALLFDRHGLPKRLGERVDELDTLRDPEHSRNGTVFRGVTDDHVRRSARRLRDITDDEIYRTIAEVGLDFSVARTLVRRRDDILARYPERAPEPFALAASYFPQEQLTERVERLRGPGEVPDPEQEYRIALADAYLSIEMSELVGVWADGNNPRHDALVALAELVQEVFGAEATTAYRARVHVVLPREQLRRLGGADPGLFLPFPLLASVEPMEVPPQYVHVVIDTDHAVDIKELRPGKMLIHPGTALWRRGPEVGGRVVYQDLPGPNEVNQLRKRHVARMYLNTVRAAQQAHGSEAQPPGWGPGRESPAAAEEWLLTQAFLGTDMAAYLRHLVGGTGSESLRAGAQALADIAQFVIGLADVPRYARPVQLALPQAQRLGLIGNGAGEFVLAHPVVARTTSRPIPPGYLRISFPYGLDVSRVRRATVLVPTGTPLVLLAAKVTDSSGRTGGPVPPRGRDAEEVMRDFPWLPGVNPDRDRGEPLDTNSLMAAIATDVSLERSLGHEAPPASDQPGADLLNYQRRALGLRDDQVHPIFRVPHLDAVSWALWASPLGSRGLILVEGRGGATRAFNVIADSVGVTFLDGQRGTLMRPTPPDAELIFLPLTAAVSVPPGAVALDPSDILGTFGSTAELRRQLDLRFGEIVGPSEIRVQERGKLNALWRPLGDLPPGLVTDNRQLAWTFTVTESGQLNLGAELLGQGLDEGELEKLAANISSAGESISAEDLAVALDTGHASVAVAFDESGRVVVQAARISGELRWREDRRRWEVNDSSGRYMVGTRGEVYNRDRLWWLGNVAAMLSEQLGETVFVAPESDLRTLDPPMSTPRLTNLRMRVQAEAIADAYLVPGGDGAQLFRTFLSEIDRDLRQSPSYPVAEVIERAAVHANRYGLRRRTPLPAVAGHLMRASRWGQGDLTQQEFAMASAYFGAEYMDSEEVFTASRREMLLRAFRVAGMTQFVEILHDLDHEEHDLAKITAQYVSRILDVTPTSTYTGQAVVKLSDVAMTALGVDNDVLTLSHPLVVRPLRGRRPPPIVTFTLRTGLTHGDWIQIFIPAGTRFTVTERFDDGSVHLVEITQDDPSGDEATTVSPGASSAVGALLDPPTRVTPGLGAGPDAGRADGSAAVVVPR